MNGPMVLFVTGEIMENVDAKNTEEGQTLPEWCSKNFSECFNVSSFISPEDNTAKGGNSKN